MAGSPIATGAPLTPPYVRVSYTAVHQTMGKSEGFVKTGDTLMYHVSNGS